MKPMATRKSTPKPIPEHVQYILMALAFLTIGSAEHIVTFIINLVLH